MTDRKIEPGTTGSQPAPSPSKPRSDKFVTTAGLGVTLTPPKSKPVKKK